MARIYVQDSKILLADPFPNRPKPTGMLEAVCRTQASASRIRETESSEPGISVDSPSFHANKVPAFD